MILCKLTSPNVYFQPGVSHFVFSSFLIAAKKPLRDLSHDPLASAHTKPPHFRRASADPKKDRTRTANNISSSQRWNETRDNVWEKYWGVLFQPDFLVQSAVDTDDVSFLASLRKLCDGDAESVTDASSWAWCLCCVISETADNVW